MGRTKGSKNKKTLEKEASEYVPTKDELKAEKAFDDLVERARKKGALIEVTDYQPKGKLWDKKK